MMLSGLRSLWSTPFFVDLAHDIGHGDTEGNDIDHGTRRILTAEPLGQRLSFDHLHQHIWNFWMLRFAIWMMFTTDGLPRLA